MHPAFCLYLERSLVSRYLVEHLRAQEVPLGVRRRPHLPSVLSMKTLNHCDSGSGRLGRLDETILPTPQPPPISRLHFLEHFTSFYTMASGLSKSDLGLGPTEILLYFSLGTAAHVEASSGSCWVTEAPAHVEDWLLPVRTLSLSPRRTRAGSRTPQGLPRCLPGAPGRCLVTLSN